MTSLRLADWNDPRAPANDRLQVGRITPGWYLVAVTSERLKRDRTYVTALAYVPCPMNPWTGEPMERTRHPIIEVDGQEVPPEDIWEWWTRIAHFPISRDDFMRRRGIHA